MKICFTEKEVEKILLLYVEERYGVTDMNKVYLSRYSGDYCVVSKEETNES